MGYIIKKINDSLKNYLVTGLVSIIPLWLTYFIIAIIFKWVSNFAFPIINYYISDTYWVRFLAKTLSFFISLIFILILGFITSRVLGKNILNYIEKIIEKLPILGTVHSSAKQFINFIFDTENKKNFKKVIFVPFLNKNVYSIAFLTGTQSINGEEYVCTFMPTSPNPTTGLLLLFKSNEIIYSNYTVEQAFQFIISVGVIKMDNNK
ncbi:MAG: DUF502 domain-containing protein [Endomicrobium sp.]|jgi:uncharacterized membrane protein|nr:DUF502 domain-containing protein [Endomicrobium sp.]